MGTWRTLHLRRILLTPSAISVHGSVSPDDPRTRALLPEAKCSADRTTAALFWVGFQSLEYSFLIQFMLYFRLET